MPKQVYSIPNPLIDGEPVSVVGVTKRYSEMGLITALEYIDCWLNRGVAYFLVAFVRECDARNPLE